MLDIKAYPRALQLLMQTDGTVTDLIKILANENIVVIKLLEEVNQSNEKTLNRHIYLQGEKSKKNWLYAESKIFLNNLSKEFVNDLMEKSIPIGTLWFKYKMETFKKIINQSEEVSMENDSHAFPVGSKILSRSYQVYNQNKIIMEITEKFPIQKYIQMGITWS